MQAQALYKSKKKSTELYTYLKGIEYAGTIEEMEIEIKTEVI